MDAVRAQGVGFRYKGKEGAAALSEATFRVGAGEVYGLLGPNGAGKTTLLRLLATLLIPSAGTLEVMGQPVPGGEREIRRQLGIAVGEYERTFDLRLTGAENLRYFAAFHPDLPRAQVKPRVAGVLAEVGLTDAADKPYNAYSQGMKHRLALARALLPEPQLLLLDEPTSGVDATTARTFLTLVRGLADRGMAVVYATHHLNEAGDLCDRVLVLREGRTVAEERPDALRRMHEGVDVLDLRVEPAADDALLADLARLPDVVAVYPTRAGGVRVHVRADTDAPFAVFRQMEKAGRRLRDVRRDAPSLEDAFLRLTGGAAPPGGAP